MNEKGKIVGTNAERITELEQWSVAQDRLCEKYRRQIADLEMRADASAITLGVLVEEMNKRKAEKILPRVKSFSTEIKKLLSESMAERRKGSK